MNNLMPSMQELQSLFEDKYPDLFEGGWGPITRQKFGYYTPDDYYEGLVEKLIQRGTKWADIGCGRDIFPSNALLARKLAAQCEVVAGIDPDPNIDDNDFVTEAHKVMIEDFSSDHEFDLVTLRMVAEHISNPEETLRILASITQKDGLIIIYTPHKWAPVSFVARWTPMSAHHWVKSRFWGTEERDTFPVEYKMNTKKELVRLFDAAGFEEASYELIDDCRIFNNFRVLNYLELCFWQFCRWVSFPYPEKCIIGAYRKK